MPNHGLGSLTVVWVSETMVRVRETVVLDLDVLPSGEIMLIQEYEFNLLTHFAIHSYSGASSSKGKSCFPVFGIGLFSFSLFNHLLLHSPTELREHQFLHSTHSFRSAKISLKDSTCKWISQ